MSIFKIMSDIEDQVVMLEQARAVLFEAMDYFDVDVNPDSPGSSTVARNSEQIGHLLHVINHLIFETVPELEKASDNLLEIHKSQKEAKTNE